MASINKFSDSIHTYRSSKFYTTVEIIMKLEEDDLQFEITILN
jgi:hypothetical protein